jgi:hypothetical protein
MRPTVMGRWKRRGPTLPIEKECAVLCLDLGLVRMTIDHRVDFVGGPGGQARPECVARKCGSHRSRSAASQVRAPGAVIDVSAHGVDRRQRAKPRKYFRAANIPGMDDGIAAGKRRERLRPQQAMGFGNRANGSHHARPDYKMSRAASPVL